MFCRQRQKTTGQGLRCVLRQLNSSHHQPLLSFTCHTPDKDRLSKADVPETTLALIGTFTIFLKQQWLSKISKKNNASPKKLN